MLYRNETFNRKQKEEKIFKYYWLFFSGLKLNLILVSLTTKYDFFLVSPTTIYHSILVSPTTNAVYLTGSWVTCCIIVIENSWAIHVQRIKESEFTSNLVISDFLSNIIISFAILLLVPNQDSHYLCSSKFHLSDTGYIQQTNPSGNRAASLHHGNKSL